MKKCPKCGNKTNSKFCPECGEDLSAVEVTPVCPKCGVEVNSKFCPECGAPIEPIIQSQKELEEKKIGEVIVSSKKKKDDEDHNDITFVDGEPQREKKKKISKKKAAIIIAAVLMIIGLIGVLGSGTSSNNETTSTVEETEEEPIGEEQPTENPEPEPEPEKEDAALFGEFTKAEDYDALNYDHLARNPDDYEGKMYTGSGKVLQVLEGNNEVDMRVAIDEDYDTVVYLVYSPSIVDSRILEDDYVTFYGESKGLYSYESTMGGTITIPMLYVHKIERS